MEKINISFFLSGLFVGSFCVIVGSIFEQYRPAQKQCKKVMFFNICYSVPLHLADTILIPLVSGFSALAVNSAGGGLIILSSDGYGLLPAAFIYTFAMDFGEYVFHRAQHRFPLLWSMHSFHHSDSALNVSSAGRHYWVERSLKMMSIYILVAIIFKTNPMLVAMHVLISFYNYFLHMNIRSGFGRWSVLINSPQYHRIHHSALPEHRDCNFAALFPIFDVVFGTYRQPQENEYPSTGIDGGEQPSGLVEAIFWPLRSPMRRFFGGRAES